MKLAEEIFAGAQAERDNVVDVAENLEPTGHELASDSRDYYTALALSIVADALRSYDPAEAGRWAASAATGALNLMANLDGLSSRGPQVIDPASAPAKGRLEALELEIQREWLRLVGIGHEPSHVSEELARREQRLTNALNEVLPALEALRT